MHHQLLVEAFKYRVALLIGVVVESAAPVAQVACDLVLAVNSLNVLVCGGELTGAHRSGVEIDASLSCSRLRLEINLLHIALTRSILDAHRANFIQVFASLELASDNAALIAVIRLLYLLGGVDRRS